MAYLILLCAILLPTVAHADPVSIITSAIITGMGLTGWSAFFVALAGSAFGMERQKRKQKKAAAAARDAYNASLEDRASTVLEANPPARICYGKATFAGSPVAILTSGDRDQYKHVVIEWAHHECEEVLDYLIDGVSIGTLVDGSPTTGKYSGTLTDETFLETVVTDANGQATLTTTVLSNPVVVSAHESGTEYNNQGGSITGQTYTGPANKTLDVLVAHKRSAAKIKISTYLGTDTQNADPYLVSVSNGKWTANHRLLGRCYSVVTLNLDEQEFQNGFPQLTATIKGKKVFDTRTDVTVWSDNAALCIADYISSPLGKNADYATIIESDLIAAANACDEMITPVGGSAYSRYTINGVFTSEDDPLEAMAQAMAGVVSCPGGWSIMAGVYTAPVLSLTDGDFVGDFEVVNGVSRSDLFNGVTGRYYPVENPTVNADFKPYVNTSYVATDGEELFTDFNYPFTNTATRVEQLNRIAVEDHRQALTIRCGATLKAWELRVGQRVNVTVSLYGFTSKVFRVMDWALGVSSPVMLTLKEDTVGIWDAADDVQYDQAPDNTIRSPFVVDDVDIWSAQSGTDQLIVSSDGTVRSRILLTYGASTDVLVTSGGWLDVEINRPDIDAVFRGVATPDGKSTSVHIDWVEDGRIYNIRARWNNGIKYGSWAYISHTVVGKSEAPTNVPAFTIAGDVLSWTTVSDIDLAGYVVKYHLGQNTDWGTAIPLHDGLITETPYRLVAPISGAVTFMIKAVDTSGNQSNLATSIYTNMGDPDIANVVQTIDLGISGYPGEIDGGTVVGATIEADALDSFYGPDNESFYGPDSASFYEASSYGSIVYVTNEILTSGALSGSAMYLDVQTSGASSVYIEYRDPGPGSFYGDDLDSFYGSDGDPFYGPAGEWLPWPGQITTGVSAYQFRVTVYSATDQQAVIDSITITIDAPDMDETIDDLVISSSGTPIPYTKPFTYIGNIQATLQANSSGGETVEIDKANKIIRVYNSSHVAVSGASVDLRLKGY